MKVLLLNSASTLAMTGIIWFVQIVHYPLFLNVGSQEFARYETLHQTYTGWVVAPLMLVELLSASALLIPAFRPLAVSAASAWIAAALVIVIWLSTAALQIPLHNQLAQAFSPRLHLAPRRHQLDPHHRLDASIAD